MMNNEEYNVFSNGVDNGVPLVTVYTPYYNSKDTVYRTIGSVLNQTFTNIEYLIIDNASDNDNDLSVELFEKDEILKASFPIVLYAKARNGGVHSSRNLAIKLARGKFIMEIDADDEIKPNTLERNIEIWESIKDKAKLRSICSVCVDDTGMVVGGQFPDNINSLPYEEQNRVLEKVPGEKFAFGLTQPLKNYSWPIEDGVDYVLESIVWDRLTKDGWRAYYTNESFRIYHNDRAVSLTRNKKKSIRNVRNIYFNFWYILENWDSYNYSYKKRIECWLKYCLGECAMKQLDKEAFAKRKLSRVVDKISTCILSVPMFFYSKIYIRKWSISTF